MTPERIYADHGFTGTNRARPDLDQALAAVLNGDTLVAPSSTASPDQYPPAPSATISRPAA